MFGKKISIDLEMSVAHQEWTSMPISTKHRCRAGIMDLVM